MAHFKWSFLKIIFPVILIGVIIGVANLPPNIPPTNLGNHPPFLQNPSPSSDPTTINDTDSITFSIAASDPDGDALTYSWYFDESIMQGNETSFTYSSVSDHGFTTHCIVKVTDGVTTSTHTWHFTVQDVNHPPQCNFQPAYDPQISAGNSIEFNTNTQDLDENDDLSYFWQVNDDVVVNWGSQDAFVFDTAHYSTGTYAIFVNVTDSKAWTSHTWTLTVSSQNFAPTISNPYPSGTLYIYEGQTGNFSIQASDPNTEDILSFQWIVDDIPVGSNQNYYNYTGVTRYNLT